MFCFSFGVDINTNFLNISGFTQVISSDTLVLLSVATADFSLSPCLLGDRSVGWLHTKVLSAPILGLLACTSMASDIFSEVGLAFS